MGLASERKEFAELKRLSRVKQIPARQTPPLGDAMIAFFKHSVEKRQTKLGKIAEVWAALVPETLTAHCALESFTRGTLVVLVDTSSHLYELKQVLLAGLQEQILLACKSTALRKINLKPGRWYDPASEQRRPRFE